MVKLTGRGVVSLGASRPAITYTVRIRQGWEGELAVWVQDVADDKRSRLAIADALRRAAAIIEDNKPTG